MKIVYLPSQEAFTESRDKLTPCNRVPLETLMAAHS